MFKFFGYSLFLVTITGAANMILGACMQIDSIVFNGFNVTIIAGILLGICLLVESHREEHPKAKKEKQPSGNGIIIFGLLSFLSAGGTLIGALGALYGVLTDNTSLINDGCCMGLVFGVTTIVLTNITERMVKRYDKQMANNRDTITTINKIPEIKTGEYNAVTDQLGRNNKYFEDQKEGKK